MAIQFDPTAKRIVLDSAFADTRAIYSAWKAWAASGDNLKWAPAFRVVGGDPLGAGRYVPTFLFLNTGWKLRPMESNHTLHIQGGQISSEDGSDPVAPTLGSFNVLVDREVPVAAIGVETSGGSGGLTEAQMRAILESVLVKADITKVNGVTIQGSGVQGDAWRPL